MKPAHLTTVFAGGDVEATAQARAHLAPYPPSSPSIALLKDGKVAFMLERRDIEGRPAERIAQALAEAFDAALLIRPPSRRALTLGGSGAQYLRSGLGDRPPL